MLRSSQLVGFGRHGVKISPTVLSATSNGSTITIPAGARAGDIAYLFDVAYSLSTPSDVVPSGFSGLYTVTGGGTVGRLRVSKKILVTADAGVSKTGMNGSQSNDKVMLVFRANWPIATSVESADFTNMTTGNPTLQTITASGGRFPLIVFGLAHGYNSTVAFSTESPAFAAKVTTSSNDLTVGYSIYQAPPSDHDIDMNDLGLANVISGFYSQLAA
ncbi:MAG: hypothetical protein ACWA6X_01625 [Bauldia sp.]